MLKSPGRLPVPVTSNNTSKLVLSKLSVAEKPPNVPLAVPIMLEIGKESVVGQAQDAILEEAAGDLVAEVLGDLA